MDFFSAMDILSSGLRAQRTRLNLTSSNLANAQTTRTAEGGPYRRRDPVFEARSMSDSGFETEIQSALRRVEVAEVRQDPTPPKQVYDPSHPDADGDGYVFMPNISLIEEMVNMMTAARAYEASATAMRSVVDMASRALTLGR